MVEKSRANAEAASLGELWCTCLAGVIEPLAGERAAVRRKSESADPAGMLCWEQPLNRPVHARFWVCAPETLWSELGGRILRAAGLEPEPADIRSTWLEVVQQTAGALAQSLSSKQSAEVTCEAGREVPTPPAGAVISTYTVQFGDQSLPALLVAWSPELLGPEPSPEGQTSPTPPLPGVVQKSKTFDLLLDVELPVSVSFGMAQLPLKDVIKLTTGSIVELNRSVTEPVEIVVNNCVIARGEVVVIDGNYGVRINQIVSRQERLRTLR